MVRRWDPTKLYRLGELDERAKRHLALPDQPERKPAFLAPVFLKYIVWAVNSGNDTSVRPLQVGAVQISSRYESPPSLLYPKPLLNIQSRRRFLTVDFKKRLDDPRIQGYLSGSLSLRS